MADSEYMHADLYAQHVGITGGVLEGWIKRGLEKGVHYVVIGHQTLIHVKRADQWISERGQLVSDPAAEDCRSDSGKVGSLYTRKRLNVTLTQRVISPRRQNVGAN